MSRDHLIASLALAAALGCSSTSGASGNADAGDASATDLSIPCDVNDLLVSKCAQCHGATPSSGAPSALVTWQDLNAPSKTDPTKSNAQLSIERMNDTSKPMPPLPGTPASAAQIASIQAFIDGKTPHGDCTGDATAGDPYGTPSTCTSNRRWALGDTGSSAMHPGQACITCHSASPRAPTLDIAGTVFSTAHEPTDCNGINGSSPPTQVVIVDAANQTHRITVNSSGNFYFVGTITPPYHAMVAAGGKERIMVQAQTSGDCNSCHSESGSKDAPGRIVAP
jgi:hypothetical protein